MHMRMRAVACLINERRVHLSVRPSHARSDPKLITVGSYITLHYLKSYLDGPKLLRTATTLYEIKGVMWEYSYVGKHFGEKISF